MSIFGWNVSKCVNTVARTWINHSSVAQGMPDSTREQQNPQCHTVLNVGEARYQRVTGYRTSNFGDFVRFFDWLSSLISAIRLVFVIAVFALKKTQSREPIVLH